MSAPLPVNGLCDAADRLVEADEALAGLQLRCGGEMPGTLAIPALLQMARQTRQSGVAQTRSVGAIDDGRAISFVAHVVPDADGTRLRLSQWRLVDPAAGDGGEAAGTRVGPDDELLRQMAALHAVLDAGQAVIAVDSRGAGEDAALLGLAERWRRERGLWSDAVELVGIAHRQPLHWRLLDDAPLTIAGSERTWRARLLPRVGGGFDLLILPDAIDAVPHEPPPVAAPANPAPWSRLIGRDLAPALRQPIHRIVANAETIRTRLAGPLAENYAGYAADIAEAARHLMALVEDLADLDAVEAPEFAPAPDAIDLADCARRAAGILAMRAQERGIRLILPDEGATVPATGEFRRVLQVLLNLLTNAIRYGPPDSTVTLAAGHNGAQAWISVSDEGQGLSAEQAVRVFEKFERLGRSGDGGSGLGLYISRRLARAMQGDLMAGPRADGAAGACFTLSLPAR